jgi:hypothetical protein
MDTKFALKETFALLLGLAGVAAGIFGLFKEEPWIASAILAVGIACGGYLIWVQPIKQRMKLPLCVALISFFVVLVANGFETAQQRALRENGGLLVPADLPDPPTRCALAPAALHILLGDSTSWTSKFPHSVIRLAGRDLLAIDKTRDGSLSLTLHLFDDRNDVVASIENNQMWTKHGVRFERPTKHRLVVFDHWDEKVLDIRFINRSTVQVSGTFRYRGRMLKIGDAYMVALPGGGLIGQTCTGAVAGADISVE